MVKIRGRHTLKKLLISLSIGISGVIFLWPTTEKGKHIIKTKDKLNLVIAPRIRSIDSKKQPFEIKANFAKEQKDTGKVKMQSPTGQIQLNPTLRINACAHEGMLKKDRKSIVLSNNVVVETDHGYQLKTAKLCLDLENKKARTNKPVHGISPHGTINAQGVQIDQNGNVTFIGKTSMIIKN